MSFEIYKAIHIISLIVVTACLGIGYFAPRKWAKMLGMTASLLLMIAGMGLLAKAYAGQNWPTWVIIKIFIWLVVAISGPMMAKRLTKYRAQAFFFLIFLLTVAICLAIFKPFVSTI